MDGIISSVKINGLELLKQRICPTCKHYIINDNGVICNSKKRVDDVKRNPKKYIGFAAGCDFWEKI